MQVEIEDFKTGWYGLTIGLKAEEIDDLISALTRIKRDMGHFHVRSDYDGDGGVGDIEVYCQAEEGASNMVLDSSRAIFAHEEK